MRPMMINGRLIASEINLLVRLASRYNSAFKTSRRTMAGCVPVSDPLARAVGGYLLGTSEPEFAL